MRRALAPVAAAGMLLAACGDDDDKTETAVLTVKETQPSKGKFALTGLRSVPAGPVRVRFTNHLKDPHEVQLVRAEGHSQAEVLKLVLQDEGVIPSWLHAAGGVGTQKPGGGGVTTEILPPGKYYALDNETGDELPSPARHGAIAAFEVTGDAKSANLPKSTAQVTATDVGADKLRFKVSGLKSGSNTLKFVNESKKELRHVIAIPLLPGKREADAKKFFDDGQGKPPMDFDNTVGTSVLDQKTEEVTTFSLKSGKYVLVCFLPDRDGKGEEHFKDGMLKEVDVP